RKVVVDYLNVQNRLLWFIRDQRALIVSGVARMPYLVNTELVEMDRAEGWAHFKSTVRDVLGNEVTMYGSESAKDFPDFAEKAGTKSLGRALLALGYGTAFAPEMDEGERVVDTPTDQRNLVQRTASMTSSRTPGASEPRSAPAAQVISNRPSNTDEPEATEKQLASIRKLCEVLGKPEPAATMSYSQARELITQLSGDYQRVRRAS
ncbi:MAG TPA: hypothetical protein VH593_13510, partial [Ktedonobacteraceae bacterium]